MRGAVDPPEHRGERLSIPLDQVRDIGHTMLAFANAGTDNGTVVYVRGGAAVKGLTYMLVLLLVGMAPGAWAGEALFEFEQLRGIPTANLVVRNIAGGGLPWTIAQGEARLQEDGTLKVEVEGLVLAAGPNAGTNPVGQFLATLSCLNADGTINNISTNPVPATSTGDARIEEVLPLPDTCLGPIVFVQGFPSLRWFAMSGF